MSHSCFFQTPAKRAIQQPNPVITKHIFNNKQYNLPPAGGGELPYKKEWGAPRKKAVLLRPRVLSLERSILSSKKYDRRQCAVLELVPLRGEKNSIHARKIEFWYLLRHSRGILPPPPPRGN